MICIKGKHRQNLCKVVEMASYKLIRMGVNAAHEGADATHGDAERY